MTNNNANEPMVEASVSIRVPRAVEEANAHLRSYVERMQEKPTATAMATGAGR